MFMFYWYNIRRVKMSNLLSCQCRHVSACHVMSVPGCAVEVKIGPAHVPHN